MDDISLPFSFDQINELLDFCPSDDHYHFQQNNLFLSENNDPAAVQVPVGPITTHNNKTPNVEKKPSSASLGKLEDVDKMKRLIHRDVERQRRHEMSSLYRTLRSELPIECLKGKRSATDHVHETVGYIRQMRNRIQKLNQRKMGLLLNQGSSSSCNKQRIPSVQVKSCMSSGGIEVLISTDGVVNLSGVLNVVCREGLSVVHCVSARVDSTMIHTLLIQVNKGQDERAIELERKIADFCNRNLR